MAEPRHHTMSELSKAVFLSDASQDAKAAERCGGEIRHDDAG